MEILGETIQNYRIISQIGKGGMGTIYKAYDSHLDRYAVIKVLNNPQVSDIRVVNRFKREAKNHAKLNHHNIVQIYGFIEDKGVSGIAMEYVEGENLEELIRSRGKLSLHEALHIFEQILKGVEYAHSMGFIHKDIKPSNIIIASDGTVKITDFGLSVKIDEQYRSQAEAYSGTISYMSPEQLAGKELTLETDIYAIGAALYEAVAGSSPFESGRRREDGPPSLNTVMPEIPPELDKVLKKTLEFFPEKRYSSCMDFLLALNPIKYIGDSYPYSAGKKTSFSRKVKNLFIVITVLSFVGLITMFVFNQVSYFWNGETKKLKDFGAFEFLVKYKDKFLRKKELIDVINVNSGTNSNLMAVYFSDKLRGIACGEKGIVLLTDKGGLEWRQVTGINASLNFTDCYLSNNNVLFLLTDERELYRSSNMGKSWSVTKLPAVFTPLRMKFFDKKNCYISGTNGIILKSSDNGKTWKKTSVESAGIIYDLDFQDRFNGLAVGTDGEFLKTTDGGNTWVKQKKFSEEYLKRIEYINDGVWIAAGADGNAFISSSGGINWIQRDIISGEGFRSVVFLDNKQGVIAGANGSVFRTTDAGESWEQIAAIEDMKISSVAAVTEGELVAVGSNGLIKRMILK